MAKPKWASDQPEQREMRSQRGEGGFCQTLSQALGGKVREGEDGRMEEGERGLRGRGMRQQEEKEEEDS